MKVEYRNARKGEEEQLKKLWQLCFLDSQEYIDFYFQKLYSIENAFVCAGDGLIMSMMMLLPAVLRWRGRAYEGRYVYAVATLPEYRGLGYMKGLEAYAERCAEGNGADFLFLVPAEPSLMKLYECMGFEVSGCLEERLYERDFLELFPYIGSEALGKQDFRELGQDAFLQLRKRYLESFPISMDLAEPVRRYSYQELVWNGCSILGLPGSGTEGYFIFYMQEKKMKILESSLEVKSLESLLPLLFVFSGAEAVEVRLPGGKVLYGEGRRGDHSVEPYGMIKCLSGELEGKAFPFDQIYANLMLD